MRDNPIPSKSAPDQLPDRAELAAMISDRSIHRPMNALFWMSIWFWEMVDELSSEGTAAGLQYEKGFDAGYAKAQSDARKAADDE